MQVVAQLSVQDLPDDIRGLSPRAARVLVLGEAPGVFSRIDIEASVHPSGEGRALPAGPCSRGSLSGRGAR
jgi:hypothetical protein